MKILWRIYYYQYRYLWRQICIWPWQRLTRGWDDRVCWSIDYWLASIMPDILTKLKDDKQGIPAYFCYSRSYKKGESWEEYDKECSIDYEIAEKEWDKILDKMILAFEILKKDGWPIPRDLEKEKKIEIGLDLFRKHIGDLWD